MTHSVQARAARFIQSRFGFALFLLVIASGLPLITFSFINLKAGLAPPPLVYTSVPDGTRRAVCPGERFTYPFTLSVTEVPTVLIVYKSVWDADIRTNVVAAKSPDVYSYTWLLEDKIQRTSSFVVPRKTDAGKPLSPGEYVLNVGAVSEGRATAGFGVPFTVKSPERC